MAWACTFQKCLNHFLCARHDVCVVVYCIHLYKYMARSQCVPRIRVLPTLLCEWLASPHGRREWPPQRGGQKPPPSRRLGRGCSDDTFERGKPLSQGLVACLPHVQRKLCFLPMPASKHPPPGYPVRTHSSACLAHHYMYISCERTRNGSL